MIISGVQNSAAVLVLQQSQIAAAENNNPSASRDLMAIVTGTDAQSGEDTGIAEPDIFSVHHVNVTELKMQLIERLGDAFGIDRDDFDSRRAFGRAIHATVAKLKREPDGFLVLEKIAKELGLDDLGITLDELVNAVVDPDGGDDDKLDAALEKAFGGEGRGQETSQILGSIGFDEIGRYSPVKR